jgi:hypothetical protein
VWANRIEGIGAYGLDVFAFEPGQVAESNLFVHIHLTRSDASVADLFLDAYTSDNTVVVDASDMVIGPARGIVSFA